MTACERWTTRHLTPVLVILVLGLTMGPGRSTVAGSSRNAPAASLESIAEAIAALNTRLDALAEATRPPSNGQTRLLFPFVTTEGSNVVELWLANTGQDPAGTPGRPGACTVELFGTPTPTHIGALTQVALPPVSVRVGALRDVVITNAQVPVTNFVGYAVATCDFPLAHGFYFLSLQSGALLSGHALVLSPARSTDVVEGLGQ